jgi:hypothetical protein
MQATPANMVPQQRQARAPRLSPLRGACRALAACVITLLAAPSAHAEEHGYKADVAASVGWLNRSTPTDPASNPTGGSYDAAFGQTFQVRAAVTSWMRIGVYHQRGYHKLNLPAGALGSRDSTIDLDEVLAYSLGGRLEPTLVVTPRLRLWLVLGAGWGRMSVSRMHVSTGSRSYTVQKRQGVMVEFPFGFGGSYQIIPGWLAITSDTIYAPNQDQSGSLFERTQYIDSFGTLRHTQPMPVPRSTFSQMFGLALIL